MHGARIAITLSGAATAALVAVLASQLVVAGATPAPPGLPPLSADQLITSIRLARPGPLAGTVELESRLGSPGGSPGDQGVRTARLWSDEQGRRRVSLPEPTGERTIVDDGTNVWFWNSTTRSVTRMTSRDAAPALPGLTEPPGLAELPGLPTLLTTANRFAPLQGGELAANPVTMAAAVLAMLRPDSTARLDPNAMVADRESYQLVLSPVPTERTLLREIRVAVDGQTRLPLEVSVLANGSAEPALRIGFSAVSFGPQDPALFRFTPAAGVPVRPVRPAAPALAPAPAMAPTAPKAPTAPAPAAPAMVPAAPAMAPAAPAAPTAPAKVPAPPALAPAGPEATAAPALATAGPATEDPAASAASRTVAAQHGPPSFAVVGEGWDTVLVRRLRPAGAGCGSTARRDGHGSAAAGPAATASPAAAHAARRDAAAAMLTRISSPISGPWGQGRLVSTPIGNAVITADGRMATGAVPAQVLTEALTR